MTKKPRTPRSQKYNPASEVFHKEGFPFYWLSQVHGCLYDGDRKSVKKGQYGCAEMAYPFYLKRGRGMQLNNSFTTYQIIYKY